MEYKLHLACIGEKTSTVMVFDSEDASRLYRSWISRFNLGSSELKRGSGKVTDQDGKLVCTICYNGRVLLPNGQFVDGMSRQDWMTLCAS